MTCPELSIITQRLEDDSERRDWNADILSNTHGVVRPVLEKY